MFPSTFSMSDYIGPDGLPLPIKDDLVSRLMPKYEEDTSIAYVSIDDADSDYEYVFTDSEEEMLDAMLGGDLEIVDGDELRQSADELADYYAATMLGVPLRRPDNDDKEYA